MMKVLLALVLVVGLGAPGHSAQAQATTSSLDDSLQRLSEILGALHYLRPICGFKDDADRWRTEMQALIDAEAQGADRRARMVAGFNRGYSGFQQTYRACTPAAEVAIRRYLEEGAKIAREVTARYAN
jgi:uncharacterized protein (TIGR02301 family)